MEESKRDSEKARDYNDHDEDDNFRASASSLSFLKLKEFTNKIRRAEDLDSTRGDEILQLLSNGGVRVLQQDPSVLLNMIGKANYLIGCGWYTRIIQKMADSCDAAAFSPTDGPLEYFVAQMVHCKPNIWKNQKELLSCIEALASVDNSSHSRTKCLRVLIMESEYVSRSEHCIHWTEELISTLKILLEGGADPTWVPGSMLRLERRDRRSAQYALFNIMLDILIFKNHLFNPIMEVLPLLLYNKCCEQLHLRGTSLHALVDFEWKWFKDKIEDLPAEFYREYKEIISKVIKHELALLDATDWCERTPIQLFLEGLSLQEDILNDICELILLLQSDNNTSAKNYQDQAIMHYFAKEFPIFHIAVSKKGHLFPVFHNTISKQGQGILLEVVRCMVSRANTEIQDVNGSTALHLLVDKYSKEMPQHQQELFFKLLKMLSSESNIDMMDNQGLTALHILVMKIFWDPQLGHDLLPALPLLTTSNNVKAKDKHSVTPYSWILRGKLLSLDEDSETGRIFSRIEEIFLDARADLKMTEHNSLGLLEKMELMKTMESKVDFDRRGKKVLVSLNQMGKKDLEDSPEILLNMVRKANILIESTHYMEIFQKMSELSGPVSCKEGPLQCLLQSIEREGGGVLFKHQEKLFSLIKILMTADSSQDSRTQCLRFLVLNAKHTSKTGQFLWTEQLIDLLKLLLSEGADPAWIPVGSDGPSALYIFLQGTFYIFTNEKHSYSALIDLVALLLTEDHLNHRESGGTLLHALVNCGWESLPMPLPDDATEQYQRLISKNIKANPTLPDLTDNDGCTAVHILARAVYKNPKVGQELLALFAQLSTSVNVNAQNNVFETPYSWVLTGKVQNESTNRDACKAFTEIEDILLSKGADAECAMAGSADPTLRWINQDLRNKNFSHKNLQRFVGYAKAVRNWNARSDWMSLDHAGWNPIWILANEKFASTLMDAVTILGTNQSIAQNVWNRIFPDYMKCVTLPVMKILSICARSGAQPTDAHLKLILSRTEAIGRNERLAVPLLEILNFALINKNFKCHLNFLGDFFVVSEELVQLGRCLMQKMYNILDGCLKSRDLVNCLLFLAHHEKKMQMIEEWIFDELFLNNWLQRSPLHLAVIFLDSLECLPQKLVRTFIDARDINGCTPLHVAHLHHNDKAVQFLLDHGASESTTDRFGCEPKVLASRFPDEHNPAESESHQPDDQIDNPALRYSKVCNRVMNANSGVLSEIKHMIVLSETEAHDISGQFLSLFRRLVAGTKFDDAKIVIAGSVREKLKTGSFDEVDVQLRFKGYSESVRERAVCNIAGVDWPPQMFVKELLDNLIMNLGKINWDGIFLRPVSIKGPWKFIREGNSSYRGIAINVDVVPVIVHEEERADLPQGVQPDAIDTIPEDLHRRQKEILEGASRHKYMVFTTLTAHREHFVSYLIFNPTKFAFEWDVIDSLPTHLRIAIALAKALVQAYEQFSGSSYVEIPITSYTIKTALFFILAYNSSSLELDDHKEGGQILRKALETVEGKIETRKPKIKYNPNAKWITLRDLDQHGEEARVWAAKIFKLIKCLAEQGWKMGSYWFRGSALHQPLMKETEYIHDICNCVLERLSEKTFCLDESY